MNSTLLSGLLKDYDPGGYYCELLGGLEGGKNQEQLRALAPVIEKINALTVGDLRKRTAAVTRELYNLGITFTVYSQRDQIDRVLPFDALPRVITQKQWAHIERGSIQRVTAINLFLDDIYHDAKILKDKVVPKDLVLTNKNYSPQMEGLTLPHKSYASICGVDLVRGADGEFLVLEDNARTPSGVSYVVENRHLTLRTFPDLARATSIRTVSDYGQRLVESLRQLAMNPSLENPQVVLLSPGTFNSAYFEHVFLAREMGVPLVEGRDLLVDNDRVYMKTILGLEPVDIIYRRIDDQFIDPEAFNPKSLLGVPGLMRAYRAGNVTLTNAIGTGIADDKAIYAYMPRIIRYYLGEDAILPNVETHICREPEGLAYTLQNLENLVVKPVGESGGYGVVIGPRSSKKVLADLRRKLKAAPDNFISQPMISLSVAPTLCSRGVEPRHVDLRPFVVSGRSTWVLPGGLTRVALKKGSLIVNSSQGGGSKDTWVLA
ncbi:putative protein [alpha proteobacterium Q-1]|nr:putative protein [alpha proteobacterium Q-1]